MEKQTNITPHKTFLISILITQNGYSFFVLNSETKKIEICKTEELKAADAKAIFKKLAEELKQNWTIKFPNAQVQICYHHSYFAVVPSEIFDAEFASDYLKYNTKIYANDSISTEVNSDLELHIPFVPYVNIHNEVLNTYESIDFTHSINSSINWAKKLSKNQEGEHAFAFVQKEAFVLVLMENEKLQLANYFEYQTAEDFAYFCLFAIQQNQLDREQMHFSILGDVSIESEMHQLMYTYIKNVVLISFEELNFQIDLNSIQKNFFNTNPFLALQLCE